MGHGIPHVIAAARDRDATRDAPTSQHAFNEASTRGLACLVARLRTTMKKYCIYLRDSAPLFVDSQNEVTNEHIRIKVFEVR
jgi:hypothetical protein